MSRLVLNQVEIRDSFAEAFPMKATRIVITAHNDTWVRHVVASVTGFATSVIACEVEAGVDRWLTADETPDGRPGVVILICAMSAKVLRKQVEKRIGQCVLTCPTTAVFCGSVASDPRSDPKADKVEDKIEMGSRLRYFGDGFQISKQLNNTRYWRIPVMDGEFVCQESTELHDAVGGGNFLMLGTNTEAVLNAAQAAVTAMNEVPDVILPFPGGVVRSGSKVGSKYPALMASTNHAYCPTLRGLDSSKLPADCESVLEIVIDGLSEEAVARATVAGVKAACDTNSGDLLAIDAGNYGGQLGKYHFHLHKLLT